MHFLEWKLCISIKISLKFVPQCTVNNIPALVQIMAWRCPGDKPLSEPMMAQYAKAYMRHYTSMYEDHFYNMKCNALWILSFLGVCKYIT